MRLPVLEASSESIILVNKLPCLLVPWCPQCQTLPDRFKIPQLEIGSPNHSRSYTHKVTPTWLPKCEPNKDDTSGHAKVDRGKHTRPQPCAENTDN